MNKRKVAALLTSFLFLISAALALGNTLEVVQWKITDLFFKQRVVNSDITVIAIDDKSLSPDTGLGRFRDWPRSYYSQMLRTINAHKPAIVAFDLDFSVASKGMSELRLKQLLREYERLGMGVGFGWYGLLKNFETDSTAKQTAITHPDDIDFQKAITESSPVVLASRLILSEFPEKTTIDPAAYVKAEIKPIFSGDTVKSGYVNVIPDRDGVLRRHFPHIKGSASFAQKIAQQWKETSAKKVSEHIAKGTFAKSDQELQRILFHGKPFSYRTLSFVDVLSGRFEPASIQNKIVLVGATASIIGDTIATPTSKDFMPGVEVNANIVQQLIEGTALLEQGRVSLLIVLLVFSALGTLLFIKLNLRPLAIVFAAILLGYPLVAYGLYQRGLALSVVYPEITLVLTALTTLWYRSRTEFKEKGEIKRAFSHYVSPIVVDELVNNPKSLRLGGRRQEISVLFSDIVGFTTFSEKLSPEDTVAVLNDYLTAMTDVIFTYHGTLDKYQGDAIMALYGAPLDDVHHAVNAGYAALGMRKALVALHEKWGSIPQLPFKEELTVLDFRVGIATGHAVIGNVGSEKRFDYTAIGDIVNLGSRLESINRKYGTRVIVDKGTFVAVTNNHNPFVFRKLDVVRVKGKRQETEIFELFGLAETLSSEIKQMLDDFENGRILYTQRNWSEAKQYFEAVLAKVPDDGPAHIYLNRCNYFMRKPPAREWDTVVELHEK